MDGRPIRILGVPGESEKQKAKDEEGATAGATRVCVSVRTARHYIEDIYLTAT
jgi:hypothetical protein